MTTTDAFRNAVIEYLKPFEGNFNYENLLNGHLDISRFDHWVNEVGQYRRIANSVVLSSGCSSAGDLEVFMKAGAARAYGIEVDNDLANLARKRLLGMEFEGTFQIDANDGFILPYNSNHFDIIFSMHVIEHTKNPVLYLTELFRVLRPGGIVFLDVPNRYYKIEQHILLPYIHFPPAKLRDMFLKLLLSSSFSAHLSKDTKYKLETFIGFQFPSAAQLMQIYQSCRATYSLDLLDAFFHSYTSARVGYKAYPGKYLVGRARKQTTFRMVIGKCR